MKQTVTDLNDLAEPTIVVNSVVEHYDFESYFSDLPADISSNWNVDKLSKVDNCKVVPFIGEIVHNVYNVNTNFRLDLSSWMLFFVGSRSKYGVGDGCVLIDPKCVKWMINCRLEFQCINNIVEYEPLEQGLKKAIYLGAMIIQCYGDLEIIIKQVRNQIQFLAPHILNYIKN